MIDITKHYVTHDGDAVELHEYVNYAVYPVRGVVKGVEVTWTAKGQYKHGSNSPQDLVEVAEKFERKLFEEVASTRVDVTHGGTVWIDYHEHKLAEVQKLKDTLTAALEHSRAWEKSKGGEV